MKQLRLALAQINTTVGDVEGNRRRILRSIDEARQAQADVVVFPELALTGYPPEDLLLRPQFITDNLAALNRIARAVTKGIAVVVGFADRAMGVADRHDGLYNAAACISDGRVVAVQHKACLPNYGVFDEQRYFQAGRRSSVVVANGITFGINICEDLWVADGPLRAQALVGGAEVLVNISASPYHRGKLRVREELLAARATETLAVVAYVNLVGGQDELVFDGNSLVVDHAGAILARGRSFEEDMVIADVDVEAVSCARARDRSRARARALLARQGVVVHTVILSSRSRPVRRGLRQSGRPAVPPPTEEVYRALRLGIGDYIGKNGFEKAVLGLSGGIDSALTAVLAVDALGADNVVGVFMPSPYSAQESREDAEVVARALGIRFLTLPITPLFQAYRETLAVAFTGRPVDVTEENLQARIRGTLLMALSNKFGWLVLTTGNKSEMSVGYATLYGDMAGGFAAIKDVPKTLVYELARWRNGREADPLIPTRVLTRPPTAELRPNQTDQDSLPPYDVLDPIIRGYVEEDQGVAELVAAGFDWRTIESVMALVDRSEYKRRQSPLGVKITHRALGKDRRMPITNGYRGNGCGEGNNL